MKHHISCLYKTLLRQSPGKQLSISRYLSTQEATERRNHLFTLEKKRQTEQVGRIEKIEVRYKGVPEDCTFVMNQGLSTPHDCARHLSEWHAESSALALVDGQLQWDMHRPLTGNCTLELLNYTCPDPMAVNFAFWRTCSLLLGACAVNAFKESVPTILHSFPKADIRSGSFIYDIDLPSLPNWEPTYQELLTLSAEFFKFTRQALPIERLEVGQELAKEMFVDNKHKGKQIPSIARNSGKVTLYRVGKHIDISKGPLISNTSHVGRVAVAAVHRLKGSPDSEINQLYRFQGVALPKGAMLNHFAFSILVDRAKKLNRAISPIDPFGQVKDSEMEPKEKQQAVSASA